MPYVQQIKSTYGIYKHVAFIPLEKVRVGSLRIYGFNLLYKSFQPYRPVIPSV